GWWRGAGGPRRRAPGAARPLADGGHVGERYHPRHVISGRDLVQPASKARGRQAVALADPDFDLEPQAARAQARDLKGAVGRTETRGLPPHKELPPFRRLPGTAAEVRARQPGLQKLAGQEPAVYTGARALEGVFKGLKQPRVLVLSTHGFFLEDQDDAVAPRAGPDGSRGLQLVELPQPEGKKTARNKVKV